MPPRVLGHQFAVERCVAIIAAQPILFTFTALPTFAVDPSGRLLLPIGPLYLAENITVGPICKG